MGTFSLAKLPQNTLTALYGTKDDVTLFWAHHEKLCVVDRKLAFMGGLDMCKYFLTAIFERTQYSNDQQASEDGTPTVTQSPTLIPAT